MRMWNYQRDLVQPRDSLLIEGLKTLDPFRLLQRHPSPQTKKIAVQRPTRPENLILNPEPCLHRNFLHQNLQNLQVLIPIREED